MNPFEAETVDAEWSQRDAARWWRERGVREATAESDNATLCMGRTSRVRDSCIVSRAMDVVNARDLTWVRLSGASLNCIMEGGLV